MTPRHAEIDAAVTPLSSSNWVVATLLLLLAGLGAGLVFFRADLAALAIVLGGVAAVGLLLLMYRRLTDKAHRRKSDPLEQALLSNTAAAPFAISAPARRAALDDLRKKFQAGVEKFRAAGKDLYTLPWYVLVGEPGGGKTEAIRHCNVGFPPGLQEYTQGAGGTINMNWWFTNYAIILDTAGRLMFEEVPAGSTSEWTEFLRLLVRSRPNCPVNGLLLVIPADSLIKNSADEIERKAGRIAQQLDDIQRTLGVRFPVFVVVTKCDLINGFREFFENLTDPQLQHQMLGWSNPAPLDQPFNPELLDKHLHQVRQRLLRRRNLLLVDPVNTEDPNARRLDQVDALYAFPDSFMKIGPRLRRYLEMIFVAGEWSPKPLFLRGIYFTSSMREGQVLDKELADALGMPIDALKEDGRLWERERAYFLRDLFMAKVFKERGLVTRAANTRTLQRRRKLAIFGAALIGVALVLGLTWMGARQLNQSIGRQANYWTALSVDWGDYRPEWKIVRPLGGGQFAYNGQRELKLGERSTTLGEFFTDAPQRVQEPIRVPVIFRAQTAVGGDLDEQKKLAYQRLFDTAVLGALLDAVRTKLQGETADTWTPAASDALGQLYRLDVEKSGLTPPSAGLKPSESLLSLDRLFRYVLDDAEYKKYQSQTRQALQETLQWLYAGPSSAWPPAELQVGSDSWQKLLRDATDTFTAFAQLTASGKTSRLQPILQLKSRLDQFQKASEALWQVSLPDSNQRKAAYLAALRNIETAGQAVEQAVAALEPDWPQNTSLAALYQLEIDRPAAAVRQNDALLQQIPDSPQLSTHHLTMQRQKLVLTGSQLAQQPTTTPSPELQAELARLDRLYLSNLPGLDRQPTRRFRLHLRLYALAQQQLDAPSRDAAAIRASLDQLLAQVPAADPLRQPAQFLKALLDHP